MQIEQKSYQWAAPSRDDFIIFEYHLKNINAQTTLRQVCVTLWLDADFTVGGIAPVPNAPNDYRMTLTAAPFDLAAGESHTVAFGLVMGDGLAELQAHTDTLVAVYENLPVVSVAEPPPHGFPKAYVLRPNYPNPFNPATRISFALPKRSPVKLEVMNMLGHVVAILVNEEREPGNYSATWQAQGMASGIYLCRLTASQFVATQKLLLLR